MGREKRPVVRKKVIRPKSNFERITAALIERDPRHSGNDYICPVHDDKKPSLGVKAGKSGKVLIRCQAGCETEDVLKALGMKMSNLFDSNDVATKATSKPPEPLPSETTLKRWRQHLDENPRLLRYLTKERLIPRHVLEDYEIGYDLGRKAYTIPYRDAAGELINVKWYQPASRPGGRAERWTLKGHPTAFIWPPDQLEGRGVVLCEGEWDTLLLIGQKIPTVTSPSGGGRGKWRDTWALDFTGKRISITPDCDEPGRAFARDAAESLVAFAREVRVVELDEERDDGYDVSDWFRDGASAEDFKELARQSPVIAPHRLKLVSVWDRRERIRREPPPHWLFAPVFLTGTYGVLAGPWKSGKSWDLAAMAVAAASGEPLWGLLPVDEPTEVAYFFAEDDERLAVQRIEAICRFMEVDEKEVLSRIHATEAVPKFGDRLDLDVVRRELDLRPEIRFTVIDPLYRTTPGADGRALYDMGGLLGAIQQVVVNEARSGLIIGHHWNEAGRGTGPERMAGAGPAEWGRVLFSGNPSSPVMTPDFYQRREVAYHVEGSRIPHMALHVTREIHQEDPDDPNSPFHYRAKAKFANETRSALSPAVQAVLAVLDFDDGLLVNDIAERVNANRADDEPYHIDTVREALKTLDSNWGLAEHDGAGRSKHWTRKPQVRHVD